MGSSDRKANTCSHCYRECVCLCDVRCALAYHSSSALSSLIIYRIYEMYDDDGHLGDVSGGDGGVDILLVRRWCEVQYSLLL